jgi:hypothetical protein
LSCVAWSSPLPKVGTISCIAERQIETYLPRESVLEMA